MTPPLPPTAANIIGALRRRNDFGTAPKWHVPVASSYRCKRLLRGGERGRGSAPWGAAIDASAAASSVVVAATAGRSMLVGLTAGTSSLPARPVVCLVVVLLLTTPDSVWPEATDDTSTVTVVAAMSAATGAFTFATAVFGRWAAEMVLTVSGSEGGEEEGAWGAEGSPVGWEWGALVFEGVEAAAVTRVAAWRFAGAPSLPFFGRFAVTAFGAVPVAAEGAFRCLLEATPRRCSDSAALTSALVLA